MISMLEALTASPRSWEMSWERWKSWKLMCSRWCFSKARWTTWAVLSWLVSCGAHKPVTHMHGTRNVYWDIDTTGRCRKGHSAPGVPVVPVHAPPRGYPLPLHASPWGVPVHATPPGSMPRTSTHQDALVEVSVVRPQVHADPDDAGVCHLLVVQRQRGHGHRALVLGGRSSSFKGRGR